MVVVSTIRCQMFLHSPRWCFAKLDHCHLDPTLICEYFSYPHPSMYGIFPYIWLRFMVNVRKYTSPMDPMAIGWEKKNKITSIT